MLKLVSINIERDKHFETVLPFLVKQNPDVVCLQEVFEKDIGLFEQALEMKSFFVPMCRFKTLKGELATMGVAILSKLAFECKYEFIFKTGDKAPDFVFADNSKEKRNTIDIVLLWVDVKDALENSYKIATTHFTWTPDGISTDFQKEDIRKLISILQGNLGNFILTGDLNAPRGRESFSMLASEFKDNIPQEYVSSIDPVLHRVPGLSFMVDGLFSTPNYAVSDVSLVEGVSDHKAIIANINLHE